MKKNWKTFRQNVDRLIYDGTARKGYLSDDAAQLFIEKLFRRDKEASHEILEEINRRKIKWLIHFTLAFNVSGILQYGLIPRRFLEKKPLQDIIKSVFPDDLRIDNILHGNCISVSFPNYQLFYSKRNQINKKWAILLIDPEILSQCPCLFFRHNAATRNIKGERAIKGFQDMFYDEHLENPPIPLRSYLELPEHYTTSPQAEVLLTSVIPERYIKAACVEDWSVKKKIEEKCEKDFKKKIWVTKEYFGPRHDSHFWRRNKRTF